MGFDSALRVAATEISVSAGLTADPAVNDGGKPAF
jgi:hypothetical protein